MARTLGFAFLLGRSSLVLMVPDLTGDAMDQRLPARRLGSGAPDPRIPGAGPPPSTAVCQFGMRFILIGASRDVELRLRESLFRHLTTLSWPFFNRSRTGDLMSRLTSDVESVRMGVGPGVMYVARHGPPDRSAPRSG